MEHSGLLKHWYEATFSEQARDALLLLSIRNTKMATGHPDQVALRKLWEIFTSSLLVNGLVLLPVQMHSLQEAEAWLLEVQHVYQLVLNVVRVKLGLGGEGQEVQGTYLLQGYLVQPLDSLEVHDGSLAVRFFLNSFVQNAIDIVTIAWTKNFKGL